MVAALRPVPSSGTSTLADWNGEFVQRLRAAVWEGDETGITRLISELLAVRGLTRGHRIALQLRTLRNLVASLRSAAVTDELTGLYNRRGFLQCGSRFLQVAQRESQPAYLMYFDLDGLKQVNDTCGHMAGDALLRQTGNLLRDLFPDYGVFSILGRLGGDEFAVLTTRGANPSEIRLRARSSHTGPWDKRPLSLSVGAAYFNPRNPAGILELLEGAEQAMYEHKRLSPSAPSELPPDRSVAR